MSSTLRETRRLVAKRAWLRHGQEEEAEVNDEHDDDRLKEHLVLDPLLGHNARRKGAEVLVFDVQVES